MKILIAVFLLACASAFAQTTVTATVLDPNGNVYGNGTASAATVVASGQASSSTTPVSTDSTGTFSLSLNPATYIFTVCAPPAQLGPKGNPAPTQTCFMSGPIAVSGGSMNISSQLNAVATVIGPKLTGFVSFPGVGPGTNTNALAIGSGGSLVTSGTGSILATGMTSPATAQTAPGTLDSSNCTTRSLNPFWWGAFANGHYFEYGCDDTTTTPPAGGSPGTMNFVWRTNFSDYPTNNVTNRLVTILHAPGLGGTITDATHQSSALFTQWDNSKTGSSLSYDQEITSYNEMLMSGSPTFNGHAGGETSGSVIRASFNDSRTGGTPDNLAGISSQMTRSASTAQVAGGGGWYGLYSYVLDSGGGSLGSASAAFYGLRVTGLGNINSTTVGGYVGAQIDMVTNRFPGFNQILVLGNAGTGGNDFTLIGSGVSASGTPAGFWSMTGPAVFGAQAHAASGNQLEVRSGFLSLLRQRYSQATTLVNGDVALSAGWGNTATVSTLAGSKDSAFTITITSVGTGLAANPTFTLTWKDGAWANAPFSLCNMTGGTGATAFIQNTPGTTTLVGTYIGTPAGGSATYVVTCHTVAGT